MKSSHGFDEVYELCKVLGYNEAAKNLGLTKGAVFGRIKKVYPDFKTDASQGHRRWYAEDIAKMFEMKELGVSGEDMADIYGVTRRTIYVTLYKARKYGFSSFPKRPDIYFLEQSK